MNPVLVQRRKGQTVFTVVQTVGKRTWGITGQRMGDRIDMTVFDACQYAGNPTKIVLEPQAPGLLTEFITKTQQHSRLTIRADTPDDTSVTSVTMIANHVDDVHGSETINVIVMHPLFERFQLYLHIAYLLELCKPTD